MFRMIKRLKFIFIFWKFIPFLVEFYLSKEVKLLYKIVGAAAIIGYAVFPFDLIPDFLAIIGIVDDVIIITFILERLVKIAPESLKRKYKLK